MTQLKDGFSIFRSCVAGLTLSFACMAWAQSPDQTEFAQAASPAKHAFAVDLLGDQDQWLLRGVDGRKGIEFGLREDQRVDDLTLNLAFTYSPVMLDDLSHLNVIFNDEVIASIPLPEDPPETLSHAQVTLPVKKLQPYNVLEVQLIGHYTMGCEDPFHPDLWVKLDKTSQLLFDVERVALPDDLGLLPLPFFDPRDKRAQEMQFVLGQPSDRRLATAGVLASWFGALTAYRGVQFTVQSDQIPQQGHAILVLDPKTSFAGLSLPKIQGPTIAVRANPNDPTGKLLIVMGRDDDEIHQAALSLVLGAQTFSGSTAQVVDFEVQPRKPYDAPNWMPTDRPVYLGEMLPVGKFTVSGFEPQLINVPLRLPPDLSSWRDKSVPLNLLYRYSPIRTADGSKLEVLINQNIVQQIPLKGRPSEMSERLLSKDAPTREEVDLPLALLESQAELGFKFIYPDLPLTECQGYLSNTRHSAIDPHSTIDLSALPHHLAMPDLAAFRTSGFPYSRMADLSETLVLLPKNARVSEFSTFLNLLGNIGQATGYPATAVTVQRDSANLENKDLLLIEAGSPSQILSEWAEYLPQKAKTLENDTWLEALTEKVLRNPFGGSNGPGVSAPVDGAYVAGFESPVSSGRSVIVVAGADSISLKNSVQVILFDDRQSDQFQGSLVMVSDGHIKTLSEVTSYYVGGLGIYQTTRWFLSRHPTMLFLILLVGAVLISIVLYLSLRARAQRRLRTGLSDTQQSREEE